MHEIDAATDSSISPLSLTPPTWSNRQHDREQRLLPRNSGNTPVAGPSNWHNLPTSPPSSRFQETFQQSQGIQQNAGWTGFHNSVLHEDLYPYILQIFETLYSDGDVRRRSSVVDATDTNAHWLANQLIMRSRQHQHEQRTVIVSSDPPGSWTHYPPLPTVEQLVSGNMDLFYRDGEVPCEIRRHTAWNLMAPNGPSQDRRRSSITDGDLHLAIRRSAQRQMLGPLRRRSSVPNHIPNVIAGFADSLGEAKRRLSSRAEELHQRLDSLT